MTEAQWLTSSDAGAMLAAVVDRTVSGRPRITNRVSDRKLRLFCVACARLGNESHKWMEQWVDGEPGEAEPLDQPAIAAGSWVDPETWYQAGLMAAAQAQRAALLRDIVPFRPVALPEPTCEACGGEGREHGFGLTDYSRPCRYCPPVGDGSYRGTGKSPCPWLTPLVLELAQTAYGQQRCPDRECRGRGKWTDAAGDFETCNTCSGTGSVLVPFDAALLPILADALEDSGCTEQAILSHLRGDFLNASGERVIGANRERPHVRGCWPVDLLLSLS